MAAEVDGSRGVHQGYLEVSGKAYPFGDQDRMYWVWQDARWQATDDIAKPCEVGPASG